MIIYQLIGLNYYHYVVGVEVKSVEHCDFFRLRKDLGCPPPYIFFLKKKYIPEFITILLLLKNLLYISNNISNFSKTAYKIYITLERLQTLFDTTKTSYILIYYRKKSI